MTTITGSGSVQANGYHKHTWEGLANGDDGTPIAAGVFGDRSVQVVGTFGANGSINIEGSNDGGTTWAILNDPQGNALTFTAAGLEAILEYTELIRPDVTAGDGTTDLDVHLVARKPT